MFAWKPSPAVLAAPIWDPEGIQRDMEEKMEKARNCIVEIHMKDISTVRYQPATPLGLVTDSLQSHSEISGVTVYWNVKKFYIKRVCACAQIICMHLRAQAE